jgi:hypothetical protein
LSKIPSNGRALTSSGKGAIVEKSTLVSSSDSLVVAASAVGDLVNYLVLDTVGRVVTATASEIVDGDCGISLAGLDRSTRRTALICILNVFERRSV